MHLYVWPRRSPEVTAAHIAMKQCEAATAYNTRCQSDGVIMDA